MSTQDDTEDELRRYTVWEILTGRAHPIVRWTLVLAIAALVMWSMA